VDGLFKESEQGMGSPHRSRRPGRPAPAYLPRPDQFSGSLLGQCLGDALGFAVEGYPPEVCSRYVERSLRTLPPVPRGRGPFPFGQYTEDSQLARELLQSVIAVGRFEPSAYARHIAALFHEERVVGCGRATEAAARRLHAGVPWEQAGTRPPAAGNGSAMRAGPIGLLCYDDPEALIRRAHDQGRITYLDRRCSAGAVAIAGAVALALRPGRLDVRSFVDQVSEWSGRLDPSVATGVARLKEWVRLPLEKAAGPIAALGVDSLHGDGWEGISPFVTSSVVWSLYSFLRSPDDYWTTICTAIAVGGDVDTTAAMAGAISGARVGEHGLPKDLVHRLHDRGAWRLAELRELAHESHRLAIRSRGR
jgi:ADP-ribosylglycohydrolase